MLSGGEDAFFVSPIGYGAMVVADGVGSWSRDGIDPSLYSNELVTAVSQYLGETHGQSLNVLHAVEHAHESAKSAGSATLCVALVQPDGLLDVANLGDCGVRVIRGSHCVFSTKASLRTTTLFCS